MVSRPPILVVHSSFSKLVLDRSLFLAASCVVLPECLFEHIGGEQMLNKNTLKKFLFLVVTLMAILFIWLRLNWTQNSYQTAYFSTPKRPFEAVDKFQCGRCHEVGGSAHAYDTEQHCVECHQQIFEGAFDRRFGKTKIAWWKKRIRHFREAPSLVDVDRRMQREWFVRYIKKPHPVRPALHTMMPRLSVSDKETRLLADYFFPKTSVKDGKVDGDLVKGKDIFLQKGCLNCHRFSGAFAGQQSPATSEQVHFRTPRTTDPLKRLAPDLRYTRERMSESQLLAWLANPNSLKKNALMPKIEMTEVERGDVASFVMRTELLPELGIVEYQPLPILERKVGFKEVERKVFKAVCWHCHSDPAGAKGDGGPGNTGGFGYRGAGLDLGSYEAIMRGSRQPDGTYRSVLESNSGEESKLVRHLVARYDELAGKDTSLLGMPLALPPLSAKDIQLIRSWIHQGAKR